MANRQRRPMKITSPDEVFERLTDMFGSQTDSDVILQVGEQFQWNCKFIELYLLFAMHGILHGIHPIDRLFPYKSHLEL